MPERVIVLGGGIIGLACAFEAATGGALVSVIEPGAFGGYFSEPGDVGYHESAVRLDADDAEVRIQRG